MTRGDAGIEGPLQARLREAIDKQDLIFRDTFPGAIGVHIDEVAEGSATATIEVGPAVLHPGGYAHGGALAGFGDTIAAWATFPWLAPDELFTTIEFKANFVSAVSGGRLRGTGTTVHKGGRTVVIEVKISTDEAEPRLVCVMLVTQAILKAKQPGQESLY